MRNWNQIRALNDPGFIGLRHVGSAMITDEFEARVEKLIAEAREAGMSVEAMIGVLHDAAETLREGLCPDASAAPVTVGGTQ